MPSTYTKTALTFDQQLDKLVERGLHITDRTDALSALSSTSYYRLSSYWHPYLNHTVPTGTPLRFMDGTTFDDVITLYEFDRHLRLLIMDALERVEIHVRTLMTYHLGHTYGAFGHTAAENFHPKFNHADWLRKLESEALRSSDTFISHYKNKYQSFPTLPIWMTTEIMSFGTLSFGYTGLKNEDKKIISKQMGLHHRRLKDWLHKLTYIRNVCAHHSRLWNRELAIRPETVRDRLWNPPITPRKDRLFYVLLMLRFLLRKNGNGDDWAQRCNALLRPVTENQQFREAMGIPKDWQNHPLWK